MDILVYVIKFSSPRLIYRKCLYPGRIKELIIGSGGENIAPLPIESRIRDALPSLISNAMVVGDHRKFLTVLLTLRVDPDPDTLAPTDHLTEGARKYLEQECEASFQTVAEVLACMLPEPKNTKDERNLRTESNHANGGSKANGSTKVLTPGVLLLRILDDTLARVNRDAPSNAQRVQKWTILPREFSVGGGELGPTMKLRRGVVLKMYADSVDSMYTELENDKN